MPGPDVCGAVPVDVPAATGVTSRTATGGRDDPARAKAEVMTTAEATAPTPAITKGWSGGHGGKTDSSGLRAGRAMGRGARAVGREPGRLARERG